MWKNFNVETDADWQSTILDAKAKGLLSIEPKAAPKPTLPVIEPPAYKGNASPLVIAGRSSWNLRAEPDINAKIVGSVKVGEAISFYPSTTSPNGGNNFYYIERASPPAGESANGYIAYVMPVTGELPQPLPPVIVTPPPPTLETVYLLTAKEREELLGYCLQITNLLIRLQETTVTEGKRAA